MTDIALPGFLPAAEIAELCRCYRVRGLALFGSARRDDFRSDSDLDFQVLFEPDARIGFLGFAALPRALSSALGRRVDVGPKEGPKPLVRDAILASARVFSAAP